MTASMASQPLTVSLDFTATAGAANSYQRYQYKHKQQHVDRGTGMTHGYLLVTEQSRAPERCTAVLILTECGGIFNSNASNPLHNSLYPDLF
jgi:hypothetical protein